MEDIVIFCKSYSKDLYRALKLFKSISTYNQDNLPVYLSVPEKDFALFKEYLQDYDINIILDEYILGHVRSHYSSEFGYLSDNHPHLIQQLIKIEFWRTGISRNYLVIDSDSYFVKQFEKDDFLLDSQIPFTVMHECKELLQFAARNNMKKVIKRYFELRNKLRAGFNRKGKNYDFGPTPVIWSSKVWGHFDSNYLKDKNLVNMIIEYPSELQLYGEYLLHANSFPIIPVEPLFKVYHYKEQLEEGRRLGENDEVIAKNFLGVVMQSNWDRSLDRPPNKLPFISRIFKRKRHSNFSENSL